MHRILQVIYSSSNSLCPWMSDKQEVTDLVLRPVTNVGCSAVSDVSRMILPAAWWSVGCGRRAVSRTEGVKRVEGAVAVVEWKTVLKRSFLLWGGQRAWSIFEWDHPAKQHHRWVVGWLVNPAGKHIHNRSTQKTLPNVDLSGDCTKVLDSYYFGHLLWKKNSITKKDQTKLYTTSIWWARVSKKLKCTNCFHLYLINKLMGLV